MHRSLMISVGGIALVGLVLVLLLTVTAFPNKDGYASLQVPDTNETPVVDLTPVPYEDPTGRPTTQTTGATAITPPVTVDKVVEYVLSNPMGGGITLYRVFSARTGNELLGGTKP